MSQLELADFSVAFDVEGTLGDTIPTHHAARQAAFDEHGFGYITPEQHALGPTYGSTIHAITGGILHAAGEIEAGDYTKHPLVQAIAATKTQLFNQMAAAGHGFDEMPGASDFVRDVAEHIRTKPAFVTAAMRSTVQPFLARYGLVELTLPDLIITHNDLITLGMQPKPAPDPYNLARQRMRAKRLLVFEDSVPGVASAKAAGAVVVAVCLTPDSLAAFKQPVEFPPDYIVQSYDAARDLLGIPHS